MVRQYRQLESVHGIPEHELVSESKVSVSQSHSKMNRATNIN
jgi:hypothetical protein